MTLATIALVGIGWRIGRRQIELMDGSMRVAENAARAAHVTAATAGLVVERLERPWLTVTIDTDDELGPMGGTYDPPNGWIGKELHVRYRFANHGRSLCLQDETSINFQAFEYRSVAELPAEPPYRRFPAAGALPLGPGESTEWIYTNAQSVQREELTAFSEGRRHLVFFGFCKYRDVLDRGVASTHETRFAFAFSVVHLNGRPCVQRTIIERATWNQLT